MRLQAVLGTARVRILASYLVLLLFSALVGGVALRSVLLARAGERVDDALVQETEEFGTLARSGRNPLTGRPFGDDVRAIFNVFLSRNVPAQGEAFFTFVGGRFHRESYAPGVDIPTITEIGEEVRSGSGSGEFEADGRRIRYLSVPVRADGIERGTFVVTSDLSSEIDQVNSDLRVAAGVALGVFLIASLLAWVVAGRVLAPLRVLRDTARSITESDLTRRIPVEGDDELADLGSHLQRDGRPARGCLREPEGVHQRRRPRAAHPDHDRARPPRAPRERSQGARGDDRARDGRARPHGPARERPAAAGEGAAPGLPPAGAVRRWASSRASCSPRRPRSPSATGGSARSQAGPWSRTGSGSRRR